MQNKSKARRVLMSLVVLMALSETVQAEPRQCYWCGPLAEQVHRSQRAPSCDAVTNPVTSCDPGYEYCAVIASSPPHVESRLCVKLYQDECYHVYCNTSKTWRMTCPCQGDLCNGPNMEREKEAFAVLTNLVAKRRSPIKKRFAQSDSTFSESQMRPMEENDIIHNSTHHDISHLDKEDKNTRTSVVEKTTKHDFGKIITPPTVEIIKTEINSHIVTPTLHSVTEHDDGKDRSGEPMQSDQPQTGSVKTNQTKDAFDIVLKTSNQVPTMSANENDPEKPNKNANAGQAMDQIETTTVKIQKAKQEHTHTNDAIKASANVPPAQALQQDNNPGSPTERTDNTTSMEPHSTTEQTATKPVGNSKNSAVGIGLHLILIVKWIAIYFYT